jgi:hypothetical protein
MRLSIPGRRNQPDAVQIVSEGRGCGLAPRYQRNGAEQSRAEQSRGSLFINGAGENKMEASVGETHKQTAHRRDGKRRT